MKKRVAIVFTIGKSDFCEVGFIALKQAHKVLGKYDFYYVIPESLNNDFILMLQSYEGQIIKIDNKYFGSPEAHNKLLEYRYFYNLFSDYEYILLHHMDAFVFYDSLEEFALYGFDYIGAPWDKGEFYQNKKYYVGNGGFSLRKVRTFIKYADDLQSIHRTTGLNEDLCIAILGDTKIGVADIDTARRFSIEMNTRLNYIENGNKLPMGSHAWNKINPFFWKPFIERCGYSVPECVLSVGVTNTIEYKCTGIKDFAVFENGIKRLAGNNGLYIWGCGYRGRMMYNALLNAKIPICGAIDINKEGTIAGTRIQRPDEIDFSKKPKIFITIKGNTKEIEDYLLKVNYSHTIDYYLLSDFL